MRISELYARAANSDPDLSHAMERAQKIAGTDKDIDIHAAFTTLERARYEEHLEKVRAIQSHSGVLVEKRFHTKDYAPSDVAQPFLPNFSVGYQDGATYIADFVCPVIPGNVQRRYYKESRRDASRLIDLKMSPKGRPPEASIDISNATYLEQGYGEMATIANKDLADAVDIPELLELHKRAIMFDLIRAREKRVVDLFMTSSNYATNCTQDITTTNKWDVGPSTSTADPLTDIRITAAASKYVAGTPNAGACSKLVFEYLRKHPKVIAAAGPRALDRVVSPEELRELLGFQYLFVGDAKYDTVPGAAAASYDYLWGKGFAVFTVVPGGKKGDPSFAKTIRHNQIAFIDQVDMLPGVSGITRLKGTHADADLVVASDRGFLLTNCVS